MKYSRFRRLYGSSCGFGGHYLTDSGNQKGPLGPALQKGPAFRIKSLHPLNHETESTIHPKPQALNHDV